MTVSNYKLTLYTINAVLVIIVAVGLARAI
jgi:hypothetical protein